MSTRSHNTNILLHEASVLNKFSHKNIVKFEGSSHDGLMKIGELEFREPYVVLELAEKGVLIDYLINTGFLPEDICRFYFLQLVDGIKHIHSHSYVHRDIKTENLLLNADFDLLISDFGHCTFFKDGVMEMEGDDNHWRGIGTAKYNPPEAFSRLFKESPAVDVFMAGVVLFIMLFGESPFKKGAVNDDQHYQHFFEGCPQRFWNSHIATARIFISESLTDLITGMLHVEPSQRLTINEIETHPWCKGPLPTREAVGQEMQIRLERMAKMTKTKKS
jgi:serine/threonine protein kinase